MLSDEEDEESQQQRKFRCDICDIAFRFQGHLDRHKRSTAHLSMLEVGGPGIVPQQVATVSEIDSPPPPPSSHQVFIRRALENATLQSHFGHLPWAAPPIQRTPPSTSVGFVNHIDPPSPSSP
ncbi:Oidioi.mRNA.OKI2018_I69.chr1.g1908.t1.cds [Oikopleura dioica]|uniref:Oidioi.mRNA.OKI2018_I69.chr1.g1908.t1.cds n=1 Tax=Oikopleura dioica TaxID=34765 RepID=A0ABN7SR24_OIKDI|nr:Oidioi.mRNA.OKI2018_I69.chr1.g1908.t1.cds [Oikopleura dioica]